MHAEMLAQLLATLQQAVQAGSGASAGTGVTIKQEASASQQGSNEQQRRPDKAAGKAADKDGNELRVGDKVAILCSKGNTAARGVVKLLCSTDPLMPVESTKIQVRSILDPGMLCTHVCCCGD